MPDPLDPKGAAVTADAMHAQTEHARYLAEVKEADYVFTVRRNQPTLFDGIAALDNSDFRSPLIVRERDHGRAEIRFIRTSTRLRDHASFPHLRQAFGIHRVRADHSGRIISSQTV